MEIPVLFLKKGQERRLRAGHLWVYSNEVDSRRSPLKDFQPGEPVALMNHEEKWLAWAYVNPNSLICARIVSRRQDHLLDQSLLVHRIKVALGLRKRLYQQPCYRLLFGESDGVPGLVVDRFGDYLAVQISTAGMEAQKEAIVGALGKVLKPRGILLRNDMAVRELEGLERYVEVAAGDIPERVRLREGNCEFETSLFEGQKTGWFYDQAANRERLLPWVAGKRVLDLFSYAGAWGVRAARAGAASVTCVDSSASALDLVTANAALNGVEERVDTLREDSFSALKALRQDNQRYDVVLVDPPAFIKRKKDLKEGTLAYRRINEAAMSVLGKDGLLVSSSCSYHMDSERLLATLQQASRHRDRFLQMVERGQQGPDHPVHPAIPETAYLKTYYLRVLPAL
ncbi:class I SAM-dependent rRNA methyltransferase [Thiolapillus brandeum]|uniref:SAM-dependent methyltransferase n=1 Tax=Thiolapillus brandeum TaxID=1076588 RepID=A0A7U6GG35_9GAMM|nr:class I SAM-dependent rRNA methyltransferase [Thiolapillus brandeum]BAO42988.1 SAM-dependent methyltransferase [Thiolapillus brandeum]